MTVWTSFTWTEVVLAAAAGLVLCKMDFLLTSAVLHRGMTHGAIAFPRWLERTVGAWLWLTVCIPPLTWIAAHKHHHVHSDTEEDPHPPGIKGVWRVMLLTWYYVPRWARQNGALAEERYLRRFRDERLLGFLDRSDLSNANFWIQLVASAVLGPAAITFWTTRVGAYILGSGYMNAIGHTYGDRPFDNLGTDARGFWFKLLGFLVAGEPLGHNYHHRYPTSPTFRPGRFDPGHWFATRVLRGVPARGEAVTSGVPVDVRS